MNGCTSRKKRMIIQCLFIRIQDMTTPPSIPYCSTCSISSQTPTDRALTCVLKVENQVVLEKTSQSCVSSSVPTNCAIETPCKYYERHPVLKTPPRSLVVLYVLVKHQTPILLLAFIQLIHSQAPQSVLLLASLQLFSMSQSPVKQTHSIQLLFIVALCLFPALQSVLFLASLQSFCASQTVVKQRSLLFSYSSHLQMQRVSHQASHSHYSPQHPNSHSPCPSCLFNRQYIYIVILYISSYSVAAMHRLSLQQLFYVLVTRLNRQHLHIVIHVHSCLILYIPVASSTSCSSYLQLSSICKSPCPRYCKPFSEVYTNHPKPKKHVEQCHKTQHKTRVLTKMIYQRQSITLLYSVCWLWQYTLLPPLKQFFNSHS